jgi:hypothetical protein
MIEIIPCLYDFKLDEENMCSKCHKKIAVITKDTQIENSSVHCGMMKLSNNDNTYFNNPTRQFLFAALIGFGANLFVLSASAQDTITKIQQELQPTEQVTKIDSITRIKGVLLDKNTNEPIVIAIVWVEIEGVKYGVRSNLDGYFEINLPFNLSTKKLSSVTLTISSLTYKTVIIEINDLKFSNNIKTETIYLESDDNFEEIIIGLIIHPEQPDIKDPDNHRKTTIKSGEIKRLPIRS